MNISSKHAFVKYRADREKIDPTNMRVGKADER